MAYDKLVDSSQLNSDLGDVADAIRAKSGGSSQLAFPSGFISEIASISGGGGLPTGMTNIGSGSFTFASRTATTQKITHNLDFIPKCVLIYTHEQIAEDGDVYCCLLTNELVNNSGTIKSTRIIYESATTSAGLVATTYNSNNVNGFANNTYFTIGYGKQYAADTTYYWFAFA